MNRNSFSVKRLTCAALLLAAALLLPFLTGQIPQIGSMLCPMHIPVLLCGFVCGWPYGLAVGFIAPLLRSLLFGMPPIFPTATAMAFELAAYGACTGVLYRLLEGRKARVYIALIASMLIGRVVWGIAQVVLLGLKGRAFTFAAFLSGAFTSAVPGIVLHIVLIPVIVMALERAGLMLGNEKKA